MRATRLGPMALLLHGLLAARGLDADALVRRAGIDPAALADPNARIPDPKMFDLWRIAYQATGDEALGLEVGQRLHPSSTHALGFAWLASASVMDGLHRVQRYFGVVTDVERIALREAPGRVSVALELPGGRPYMPEHAYDAFLVGLVCRCRAIAGEDFRPLAVRNMRARPQCADRFEALFRAPVEFSAPEYALTFDRADLERALPTANAEIALANERVVQDYLVRLDRHDVVAAARRAIVQQLAAGSATQAGVARSLNMSARTLQRRLDAHGLTFTGLLETTRRELAMDYLRDSSRTVNEIAYLLGFSELSNFSRAFKRWTGRAPSAFRVPHAGSAPG